MLGLVLLCGGCTAVISQNNVLSTPNYLLIVHKSSSLLLGHGTVRAKSANQAERYTKLWPCNVDNIMAQIDIGCKAKWTVYSALCRWAGPSIKVRSHWGVQARTAATALLARTECPHMDKEGVFTLVRADLRRHTRQVRCGNLPHLQVKDCRWLVNNMWVGSRFRLWRVNQTFSSARGLCQGSHHVRFNVFSPHFSLYGTFDWVG